MDSNKKSELWAKFSKRYEVSEDEVDPPGSGFVEPVPDTRRIKAIPLMAEPRSKRSAERRDNERRRMQREQVATLLKARAAR